MHSVLVSPRDVQRFDARYRDVFDAAGFKIVYPPPGDASTLTVGELHKVLDGISAVIAGGEPYTDDVFQKFPGLKVVARVGVGYDSVDIAAATKHGVAVTVAPGTNQESVAEHTFAMILAFTRFMPLRVASVKMGGWPREMSLPLRGQTLGIAGLGRIGKAVATRALAFGMKVIVYDPKPDMEWSKNYPLEWVTFDDLLKQSDYFSLHLPLLTQTRHIMNRNTFSKMKHGAVLVNTSRGGLVCEADLVEALKSKQLGGALLDVFEEEPPVPYNPLFAFENVLVTPHAAGVDTKSLGDMARSAAESIVSICKGDWPVEKLVNPEVRPQRRAW